MAKRKKPRAAPKKNKNDAPAAKPDESPSPAKKIAAVSSTSQQEEGLISSCTTWSVDHGAESQSEAALSPSGYFCTCCNFSTGRKSMLDEHMQQHKLKCPWCPFSSLMHLEVIHHCKFKHDKSMEMDSDPCHACVYCDFMTYIMGCLETHTALMHPDKPVKYIPKMISKQVSAEVHREDAMFTQSLHSSARSSLKIEAGSHSGAKSNPIIIDTAGEVSKDIKHEANSGSVSEKCVKTADVSTDSINKQLLVSYIFHDIEASKDLKVECGSVETKCEVRAMQVPCVEVKLEKLFCLTCPYNSVSIDEVKSHTVSQHPVGAAAATYNSKGESVSVTDTTFFCVRQSCTFSSFDYTSYQKHLIDCCAFLKTLTVLEATRLKTTIMYILDCQKKYNLSLEGNFCQFASSCLGISLPTYQIVVSTSGTLGSQISLPSNNEHVNKSSVSSSDYSSPPVTNFNHIPPHNQQTASAEMQLTYGLQANVQTPYSTYLGTAPQLQCNPGMPNTHVTSHALEDARGQFVNIVDTFSLSNASSNVPLNSSILPANSNSAPSNVSINSSNLPSNVKIICRNVLSNAPMNSNHAPSIGNGRFLQPHQFPGNNLSNILLVQNGNEKQATTFSASHLNQGTAATVHNCLVGTNLVSLASQHQPSVLINSSQCDVKAGSSSQTAMASNSAAYINHGTGNIPQNLPLNTNPVSHARQHQPGILINSGQNYCINKMQHNASLASNSAIHTNTGILMSSDNKSLIGNSNSHMDQAANPAVAGPNRFKMYSPSEVSLQSQGAIGSTNHKFPASQCNTIKTRTVFGQQSGSLMTAGHNQSGTYHTSSQYNTIAGRAICVQAGQSGILTTTGLKQDPPGNQTYTAPAGQPGTSLGYGQQPGNFMTANLNHGITANRNQTMATQETSPSVSQETYQKQQCNINPNGLGSSTQEGTSSPNTIPVFDRSGSKSRLHELAYSNHSQLSHASLNSQNQVMIQNIPLAKSVDSQTGTPSLQRTVRCHSLEQNSRGQFSCSSVSQSGQFSSRSESVGSYFGLQTADGVGRALSEQPSNIQVSSATTASSVLSLETDSAHPSHLNQGTHALRSVSVHTASRMATSPQQTNSVRPVIISSLPPSIRRQSPAAGRTYARPRGAALTGIRPSSSPTLVASQSHQRGATRQRQVRRGRGQAKSSRLSSGGTGGSHNSVNCSDGIDDDDDVIVTSGFSAEDKQTPYQHQSRPSDARLPVNQHQRTCTASSEGSHHDLQISKTHVTACSSQTPRSLQSRKRVDVGRHFENIACVMNTSASAENRDVTPEDDVEIVSVVAGQTRSGAILDTGLETPQKARPIDKQMSGRNQNNSVDWNLKDNFSSGLNDVFNDIVNSSVRLPSRPPSNSQPSVKHTVPTQKEVSQGNMPVKQQSLVRPPAYSEQKEMGNKESAFHYPSKKSLQARTGLRQISPTGLSSSVPGRQRVQQPPPHPAQFQQVAPPRAPASNATSSSPKPPAQTHQHPSVIVLDADCPTPSRETNTNNSTSKEPCQKVTVVDSHISAQFGKQQRSCENRELSQDVIVLDADPSEDLKHTETNNFKTTNPPEDVIILDADFSEKCLDTVNNISQPVSNTTGARPTYSPLGSKPRHPQPVRQNVSKAQICTLRGQPVQLLTPPHPHGALFHSRVPPNHRQPSSAGYNSMRPAVRFTVQTPRAASVSPVSVRHPNHPNSSITQKGPQSTFRGINVQNRNGSQTVATTSVSQLNNSLAVSTNVPAASVSPVSASHPNHYPNTTIAQRGAQSVFKGTNAHDRNRPQTVTTTSVSWLNNSSAVSTNVPAASVSPVSANHPNHYPNTTIAQRGPQSVFRGTNAYDRNRPQTVTTTTSVSQLNNSSVVSTRSELTTGWSEKADPTLRLSKTTDNTTRPCLPERSQLVTDPSCEGIHVNLKEHTEWLDKKSDQSKVSDNLPAVLLAKFKQSSNLKSFSTVQWQPAVNDPTDSICSQRTSLDGSAKETNPNPKVSSSPGESSNEAGRVFNMSQSIPSLLKQPASASPVTEEAVREVTDLSESNNMTLSAMDSEQIFIFDLDENESALSAMNSEEIIIFDIDVVNKQHPESVSALQNQLSDQQNMILNASDLKIIKRGTQFYTVRDGTGAMTSTANINLQNSISVPEKFTLAVSGAVVSGRNSTDGENCRAIPAQTIQNVGQNSSHVHNHLKDSPGTRDQLKNLPVPNNQWKDSPKAQNSLVLHNQLKDSPIVQNPPVLHNQLKDSPGAYNQLKDSPGFQNQLRESPVVTNQLEGSQTVSEPSLLQCCRDPQTVRHEELQVTNAVEPNLSSDCKQPHTSNQTIPSDSLADKNTKIFPKEGRKSRKSIKKHEVDETGKLPLEKKTKQRPKKTSVNIENESENKASAVEEKAVRHSDRLKTVIKDFQNRESDIDSQISDGSEFHIGDEDLPSDSDSEWSDSLEKNKKIKPKKVDPTAFNVSLKGNFKCWLCQKIYSRCTFAKHHIVKKHLAGLCAIDLNHSKETNSVCLLMFCPRSCKYATSTLVAMNSHMKTCNKPILINQGSNYMEMHKDFLDQKYLELLNWPLQTVLDSITARKTKEPAKVQRAKKPKAALGTENVHRQSCETSQTMMPSPKTSGASCETPQTVMRSPNTSASSSGSVTALRHTAADSTLVSGASQNQSSFKAHNMPAQQQNLGQKHPNHMDSPAVMRSQVSPYQTPNPCVVNNSQLYNQHPMTPTSRPISRNFPPNSRLQNAHTRSRPSLSSPEQQFSTSSSPAPSHDSTSHHVAQSCRMEECTENGEIYVVEENGIICLE